MAAPPVRALPALAMKSSTSALATLSTVSAFQPPAPVLPWLVFMMP